MRKKYIKFLLPVLIPICFSGCVWIHVNDDFEEHLGYFKNNSSRNIYIQCNSFYDYDNSGASAYYAQGFNLAKNTVSEGGAPYPNSYYHPYFEKLLIVDTDTRKLLKIISAAAYLKMLGMPEIKVVKNKDGGQTIYYNYYFVITDELFE